MTDLYVSLGTFKRIVRNERDNLVFESKMHVVTSWGPLTLIAEKKTSDRVFPDSFPLISAGYTGISSWGNESLKEQTYDEALDDIMAILTQVPEATRGELIKAITSEAEA